MSYIEKGKNSAGIIRNEEWYNTKIVREWHLSKDLKEGITQGKSVPEEGKVNAKDLKWDYA